MRILNNDKSHLSNPFCVQRLVLLFFFLFQMTLMWSQVGYELEDLDHIEMREIIFADDNRPTAIEELYVDNEGVLWIGAYSGLYKFDSYSRSHWSFNPNDSLSLKGNQIHSLLELPEDKWLLGTQSGLHFFDQKSNKFKALNDPGESSVGKLLVTNFISIGDEVFVTASNGLHQIEFDDTGKQIKVSLIDTVASGIYISCPGNDGIYTAYNNTCFYRDISVEGWTEIISFEKQEIIRDILMEDSSTLWAITRENLLRIDLTNPHSYMKYSLVEDSRSPSFGQLHSYDNFLVIRGGDRIIFVAKNSGEIFKRINLDHSDDLFSSSIKSPENDILWVATQSGRLYYLNFNTNNFHHFTFKKQQIPYSPPTLPQLFEIEPGKLLLSLQDGFSIGDLETESTRLFNDIPTYNLEGWKKSIHTYVSSGDSIWMGSLNGLLLYDKSIKKFVPIPEKWSRLTSLRGAPRSLLLDSRNNLWIAMWNRGLYRQDFKSDIFHEYKELETDIYDGAFSGRYLYEDSEANIWIGSRGGLFKYSYEQDLFLHFFSDPSQDSTMCDNTAFCIHEDTLGNIWLASYGGGLEKMDVQTGKFHCFTTDDGLLDNTIFSLLEDNQRNFWISSFKGLTKFNPYTYEIQNYTHENGLLNDEFDAFSYGKSPFTGHFFFGGSKGIDYFHPDSIKPSDYKPRVIFTDFKLFNESVPIFREDMSEDQFSLADHIQYTSDITLRHDQNVFTFDFAAIEYNFPKNNEYAYRMEGFESEWQYVGDNRSATYTNLDPGNYTFMVKASNSDGIWNENYSRLSLHILPPWWKTWWAYLLYILGAISAMSLIYFFQRRRWKLQSQLALQEQEAQRLLELDDFKTNLYSNITHEFRTPLTVISGTVDLMEKNPTQWLATGANTIRRYSGQLLGMINQILDLQKIESARMDVYPQQVELVSLTRFLLEPFEFAARNKDLTLEFKTHIDAVWTDIDVEKYAMILSNLLSNATKFTDEGKISVIINKSSEQVQLEVIDTGAGISEAAQHHIFDRFYQEDSTSVRQNEGTGIGLAISKRLVELLSGTIRVNSSLGEGTRFTVKLPVTNNLDKVHWQHQSLKTPIQHIPTLEYPETSYRDITQSKDAHQLLVIEDNHDVRVYLKAILLPYYKVQTAANGEEGLSRCIELIPDLVITDIMMPKMDGFELIEKLQTHDLTTHIPIIALTAKNTDEAKLKTIQRGADAFILKPFESSQLLAYIRMLIEKRHNLQKTFQSRNEETELPENELTDPILKKVQDLILENLRDDQIGISQICKKLHISRSQLHNKVTALTGFSTSIYVRKIRLDEAKKMLRNPHLQIAEVAYQCGFKDPSYFTRVFKKEFGESPTSLQSRLNKGS